jgi:hypothetical protein
LGRPSLTGHSLSPGLRRAMGLVLIAGLCVTAVTFYSEAPELPRSAPAAASGTPLPTASDSTIVPTPSSSPSPKNAPTTTRPNTPTKAKLPKGPGTTQPGILLIASPLPDGSFDVAEIVLLSTPTSTLRLGPSRLAHAGSGFSRAKPVASQVQVSAGDQPVRVPDNRVTKRVDLALTAPARRIELRYRLSGITVRSAPSQAGRALTAISPLVAGVPESLDVAMLVRGSTVHNIACPTIRRMREQACSAGRSPNLRVNRSLPWSGAVIVVQFDLPMPQ